MKILFIGDPHFKINNIEFVDIFIEKSMEIIHQNIKLYGSNDLLCVIAGDILDTHERLHQIPYHKALDFIKAISDLIKVVVLVGNHDYINNQQFLSKYHWMLPLKYYKNVYIADNILDSETFLNTQYKFMFVPYVPPGRFIEALNTYKNRDWKDNTCIFAHQEFRGCNLGKQNSENGDAWPLDYPLVVSGHIHKPHQPQKNIIYPGSVLQHTFGEEHNDTGLLLIDFTKNSFEKIKVDIPLMKSVEIKCSEFEDYLKKLKLKPLERIRIFCIGNDSEFKKIKKLKCYSNLPTGVKICFKLSQETDDNSYGQHNEICFESFEEAFNKLLSENVHLNSILDNINLGKSFDELVDDKIRHN